MLALMPGCPFRTFGKTVAASLLVGPEGLPVYDPTTAARGAALRLGWVNSKQTSLSDLEILRLKVSCGTQFWWKNDMRVGKKSQNLRNLTLLSQ